MTATPRQPSLARLVEFGITPDRELGQHFLIDSNVLDVVGRLLPLAGDEVVLEVGPGLGVLTAWLADRARLVHAIEIDRRLEPPLRATLAGRANVRLQFADAVSVDPGALDPPPDTMAANLPYHVATPIVVNALLHVERFCVMVQREIADRFFAAPGTKAYGAVSVLVQVACVRTGRRPVSRRVFAPEPNVDSALVAFRRRPSFAAGPEWDRLARVVHAAFGHRRKTLRNAFALAGLPPPPADVAALRAEALTPERYVRLAEELAA